ncbi:sensor histidine kinase [Flavivirga spongiicola]|uniref:Histidine kinase n=1 Tax=Flavivirga spongiicola TaxID=421621 RepID=A0ABU7XTS5_9FLAO|nr:histidine kinase [Flavivirga sp. MEBiC05379]MDO5979175.1 histidine kinase [Flavivirga sp. MEBiC05379]
MKRLLKNIELKEWGFQTLFLIILFFISSFDKNSPNIGWDKFAFFLHYAFIAFVINYAFLPFFFYKKKFVKLILALVFIFGYAYIIEEFVLEKIFYSGDRGQHISNVFFTLLDIVPLVLIMVSFKLAWDASQKQREVEQLQLSVKESELRYLKSQINPHFLFNNLNNLYSYAMENSPKTPSIILELSSVLRYMLYNCKEDFVPLSEEVIHLKHFTALNELQIENRGVVKFSASEIPDNYIIAPLILLMFIENAFKHSTASQSDNILIDININVSNNGTLSFTCLNSFLPNSNNQSLSKGIGLQNVKKRLELMYPEKYKLDIKDFNNTYTVCLVLQLETKD